MLTRGYFIGEIVDAFSDISGQVATRGRLGLTDLNKHAEDFFKSVLNHLYTASLANLNADRSNAPGLDLGDKTKGLAFQITAERTSEKVNSTLSKLTAEQLNHYPDIRILMIAGKQSSYKLDPAQCARTGFTKEDIWDVDTLSKRCMDVPIDVLQSLYDYVRSELARVKIELELPDPDGSFPTSIANYLEAIPRPRLSNPEKFNQHLNATEISHSIEETTAILQTLSGNLAKLPRITREFLAAMIDRRETQQRSGRGDMIEINCDKLDRIICYPDSKGELRLLEAYNFVSLDEPTDPRDSYYWIISLPETPEHFELEFISYLDKNSIPASRPLVHLDFSEF